MLPILVTGGAGFIGSNLCEFLLAEGYTVRCFDNFSTGHFSNIETLMEYPDFELMVGDIRNPEDCQKAMQGMSYVFHEAALGSVPRSIKDPQKTNEVNISGFLNVLVAARDAGIKRFIYAASSSTYGDSLNFPKVESVIGKPLSPYAITKYVNELYAEVFAKNYGMECIGLRYFNVFGRRQDPNGAYAAVIPFFVKQLVSHKAPTINGDGSFSRDFTYIKNVLLMNHLALLSEHSGALNQVYNTACGDSTDLKTLYILLRTLLSRYDAEIGKIEPIYGPERPGDIPHSLASIEKAQQLLGYQPKYSLKDGLEEAVDWYWENLR